MASDYNVFISWSGNRSKHVAEAIHDWLPFVLATAKPWMSENDIEKGTRGLTELSSTLSGVKIAIVCLTPENLDNRWILYEAGALSKTIDDETRLCTYLLGGLEKKDVAAPLSLFQASTADKPDTLKIIKSINNALGNSHPDSFLERSFEKWWPELEVKIAGMPRTEKSGAPKRTQDDILTEILENTRAGANSRKQVEDRLLEIEYILFKNSDLKAPSRYNTLQELLNAGSKEAPPAPKPEPQQPLSREQALVENLDELLARLRGAKRWGVSQGVTDEEKE